MLPYNGLSSEQAVRIPTAQALLQGGPYMHPSQSHQMAGAMMSYNNMNYGIGVSPQTQYYAYVWPPHLPQAPLDVGSMYAALGYNPNAYAAYPPMNNPYAQNQAIAAGMGWYERGSIAFPGIGNPPPHHPLGVHTQVQQQESEETSEEEEEKEVETQNNSGTAAYRAIGGGDCVNVDGFIVESFRTKEEAVKKAMEDATGNVTKRNHKSNDKFTTTTSSSSSSTNAQALNQSSNKNNNGKEIVRRPNLNLGPFPESPYKGNELLFYNQAMKHLTIASKIKQQQQQQQQRRQTSKPVVSPISKPSTSVNERKATSMAKKVKEEKPKPTKILFRSPKAGWYNHNV